jgi:hypothetical protein
LAKKRVKSPGKNTDENIRRATINFSLNIIIFILIGLVILMTWSIYDKLRSERTEIVEEKNDEVASEIIQVEVLNGCGVTGIADRFTDYLRGKNFDVVNTGNYYSFDVDETMVIDRIGNIANAKKIAESLGIKPEKVFSQLNQDYFLDVTVIIGKDYHKLKPVN